MPQTITFDLEKTTDYDCPYCGMSKLAPKRDKNQKLEMINGLSAEHKIYYEKANTYDEKEIHTFALMLACTNPECKMNTIVVGRIDASPDYDYDARRSYEKLVTPRFFYPTIDVVTIPKIIPEEISIEIRRSYALYFADANAAANSLRVAVECFLDKVGFTKNKDNERLHDQLIRFQKEHQNPAELLNAVKWLGNDGSHYGDKLTQSDVLKGYEVFLHVISEWFDPTKDKIKEYAGELVKGRPSLSNSNKQRKS